MEANHEIFSTIILSLPLMQEGQLSVTGKGIGTVLVNCLEGLSLPRKNIVRLTDQVDITLLVLTGL